MPAGKTKRLEASWVTALENSRALLRIQFTAFFDAHLPIHALISPHSLAPLRGYSRAGGERLFAGCGAGVGPHRQDLALPQVVHVHHGHVHPRPGAQRVHCSLGTHLPRTGHGRVRKTQLRGVPGREHAPQQREGLRLSPPVWRGLEARRAAVAPGGLLTGPRQMNWSYGGSVPLTSSIRRACSKNGRTHDVAHAETRGPVVAQQFPFCRTTKKDGSQGASFERLYNVQRDGLPLSAGWRPKPGSGLLKASHLFARQVVEHAPEPRQPAQPRERVSCARRPRVTLPRLPRGGRKGRGSSSRAAAADGAAGGAHRARPASRTAATTRSWPTRSTRACRHPREGAQTAHPRGEGRREPRMGLEKAASRLLWNIPPLALMVGNRTRGPAAPLLFSGLATG
jgi:hypothetical protein